MTPDNDPASRDAKANTKLFQVGILKEGDSFADHELFTGKVMMDSVVTMMPTAIIYVPYFWVVERLSPEDFLRLRDTSKAKVSDSVVVKSFRENHQWDDFKQSLVQHLRFEHENKSGLVLKSSKPSSIKVSIDSKLHSLTKIVQPPSKIGVRLVNIPRSVSKFPPIRKSDSKLNKVKF